MLSEDTFFTSVVTNPVAPVAAGCHRNLDVQIKSLVFNGSEEQLGEHYTKQKPMLMKHCKFVVMLSHSNDF